MIRILQIVTSMERGGLETMLMNIYRAIDRTAVQFDFLVHRSFPAAYDAEIESLGGRIYRLPPLNPFSPCYRKALRDFFATHREYRIVHAHLDCLSAIPLRAAKRAGIPTRIAHSHNSGQDKNFKYLIKMWYRRQIPAVATALLACGECAGTFLFGTHPFAVMPNAIKPELFTFDEKAREAVRTEFSAQGLLFGHVGGFRKQKNHRFLIRIFAQIHERLPDAKLLLVGDGAERERIRKAVRRYALDDVVIFAGVRTDVARLFCAMDVFLLPSHYEGFPVTLLEAMAAGLPTLISDHVPAECSKTDRVKTLSLKASALAWADAAILMAHSGNRKSFWLAEHDVKVCADCWRAFYLSCPENEERK